VVDGADLLRETLLPVYEALGLDWDPATAGAVSDEAPETTVADVLEALRETYMDGAVGASVDGDTIALAHRLAPEHRALP
jgi:octanoyl-[GcvH]:protein N-octanoyltransferase